MTTTDLGYIKFRKDVPYAKRVPTFISNAANGADEIARWVLDWNDVAYHDQPHAPHLCNKTINKYTGVDGCRNSPVLINTDTLIYSADSLVQYIDTKSLPQKRLVPTDPAKRKEVLDLYRLFTTYYDDDVTAYVYCQLLPQRKHAHAFLTQGTPFREKLSYKMRYGSIANALNKECNVGAKSPEERLAGIKEVFKKVDGILADGRKYLTGDKLSLADIAFAAISGPFIIPDEYGGSIAGISQIPDSFRDVVDEMRKTNAGQFILRVYHHDRPLKRVKNDLPKDPHALAQLGAGIAAAFGKNKSNLFYFLQKRFPVLKLPFVKLATVNRNSLVTEMLDRDMDFTVEEINAKKMSFQDGAFFLGMDRMNPQFDKERNFVRATTKREDLEMIRGFVRNAAQEVIDYSQDFGRLDVANTLCYKVLIQLIDFYFGIPAPSEAKMKEWLRVLFYDLFLNFTNNPKKHKLAVDAGKERQTWILELIEDRKQELKDGKTLPDNILNRMIIMQQEPGNEWFDDETMHRNIGGLITGILETTNKAIILVLDELFNRPDILPGAIATAQSGDMKKMYGYVSEALRFNPAQPGVIRYAEKQQILTDNGAGKYVIPAKTKVFALTAAAMMDPAAFPDPKKFIPDRDAVYMNYGYGLHECYGKYINAVTISELVAAVLRLKGVKRASGAAGKGTGLKQGPFPTHFVVTFNQEDDE